MLDELCDNRYADVRFLSQHFDGNCSYALAVSIG
jgi:hypothetical protein